VSVGPVSLAHLLNQTLDPAYATPQANAANNKQEGDCVCFKVVG
jgi:hypothetical protein